MKSPDAGSPAVDGWKDHPTRRMRLKRKARAAVGFVCYYSGIAWIWNFFFAKRGVRVLAYHAVSDRPDNSFCVLPSAFEEQLIYLSRKRHVISMDEFFLGVEGKCQLPPDSVVLTFDDGFHNYYENALPLLKKHGLPATCFVIAGKIQGQDHNFMCAEELKDIAQAGTITIGCHSYSHKSLATQDLNALSKEISESKAILERCIGLPVQYFSYPYGTRRDWNKRVAERIADAGYQLAFTVMSGVNRSHTNRFALRRTKIEWGDDIQLFKKILFGGLDIWAVVDRYLFRLQKKDEVSF